MSKRLLKIITVFITLLIYGSIYYATDFVGNEKKRIATESVNNMAVAIEEADNRLLYVTEALEGKPEYAEHALTIIAALQDDFTFKTHIPDDGAGIAYPVNINDRELFLLVGYRYFLENTVLTQYDLSHLDSYKLIEVAAGTPTESEALRLWLGLDDDSYLYFKEVFKFTDETTLLIVAHVSKPFFYEVMFPDEFEDYISFIIFNLALYWIVYSVLYNLKHKLDDKHRLSTLLYTDSETGLGNRRELDSHKWLPNDTLILFDLSGYIAEEAKEANVGSYIIRMDFASSMHLTIREEDVAIRTSENGFALILKSVDLEVITNVIERIKKFALCDFDYGYATYSKGSDVLSLVKEAEAMLKDR